MNRTSVRPFDTNDRIPIPRQDPMSRNGTSVT